MYIIDALAFLLQIIINNLFPILQLCTYHVWCDIQKENEHIHFKQKHF